MLTCDSGEIGSALAGVRGPYIEAGVEAVVLSGLPLLETDIMALGRREADWLMAV